MNIIEFTLTRKQELEQIIKDAQAELAKLDNVLYVLEYKKENKAFIKKAEAFVSKELNLEEISKRTIINTLNKFEGNRKATAKILGISERTLYRKLMKFNL